MLSGSVGIIKVGGNSKVELKEKKDRVEDAIYATKAALKEGIVPGGGVALLNASQQITSHNIGETILLRAISSPFNTILKNAGLEQVGPRPSDGVGVNVVTGEDVNMVEAGIVDPVLVTKSALKNAENLVIEKYSEEVKSAMANLLEQEVDPLAPAAEEDPMAMMGDIGAEDPMAMTDDLGAEEHAEEKAAQEFADSTVGDIPDAFDPDLDDPDDEIISIKLDSLRAELPDEDDGVFGGDDKLDDNEIGIGISDEEELDLDPEDDLDLDMDMDDDMGMESDIGVDITPEMVAEALGDMDIDEDINIDEILEAVRVDFEPQKSGWAGTPESIMKEYEAMLLAREQDSKVKEENEELRKTVAALQLSLIHI